MKKLVCTTVLCLSFNLHAGVTCDKTSYEALKAELMENWAAMHDYDPLHDEKSLARFVNEYIKEYKRELKHYLSETEQHQKPLLCAYNVFCNLMQHEPATSMHDIDYAWLEDVDYQNWKTTREETIRRSDDLQKNIDLSVLYSLYFYRAKLAQDPEGHWDGYELKLRHAYRFLQERGQLEASMTLENIDDWIDDLEQRIKEKMH